MKLKKVWETIVQIWKDPVWSKVISAGIILLIGTLWAKYSQYTFQQIYDFLISILNFQIPVYLGLLIIGILFFIRFVLKKKENPIWSEQVGNYKFKELYHILHSKNYPIGTRGMSYTGMTPPEDNLLTMFHTYISYFNSGITLMDNLDDGGYLYGVLAPKLVDYGLIDRIEGTDPQTNMVNIKYQTSELGYKFFALLERVAFPLSGKNAMAKK